MKVADPLYVLCLLADVETEFADNEYGVCSKCARQVQHRPHIPKPSILVCMDCFRTVQAAAGDGPITFGITRDTLTEVRDWIRRRFIETRRN